MRHQLAQGTVYNLALGARALQLHGLSDDGFVDVYVGGRDNNRTWLVQVLVLNQLPLFNRQQHQLRARQQLPETLVKGRKRLA